MWRVPSPNMVRGQAQQDTGMRALGVAKCPILPPRLRIASDISISWKYMSFTLKLPLQRPPAHSIDASEYRSRSPKSFSPLQQIANRSCALAYAPYAPYVARPSILDRRDHLKSHHPQMKSNCSAPRESERVHTPCISTSTCAIPEYMAASRNLLAIARFEGSATNPS